MSNQNEFQYIEAKEFLHLPVIEISDVKSFTRFANSNDLKYIFKITRGDKFEFFFPLGGIVYKIDGGGFHTLLDMQLAQNGAFPAAKEYYEAKQNNISSYAEYLDFAKSGNYNKAEYDEASKAGFKEGYEKFLPKYDRYKKGQYTAVIPSDIDNAVKLYKYALSKEIKSYKDFEKVYDAGFPDMLSYNDATSKEFNEGATYYDALKKGFTDLKEYKRASSLNIDNKKEYDEYYFLEDSNRKYNYTFDKLQLLITLSNSENGTVVSVPDARKLLEKAQDKFKKPAGHDGHKVTPLWYTKSIETDDKLLEFLKTNKELKQFGFFNSDKKSFEIFKASAVKIYIDASNVAHNNKGEKVKPEIKNIRLLVKELRFIKFKDIIVIADASLKHKVKDIPLLEELRKECEYLESPAGTAADEFLIASIKKEKCLVISNDTFKDWKKDKWVRDNIDNIRVPFMIKNDYVILTGMEELRKKLVTE